MTCTILLRNSNTDGRFYEEALFVKHTDLDKIKIEFDGEETYVTIPDTIKCFVSQCRQNVSNFSMYSFKRISYGMEYNVLYYNGSSDESEEAKLCSLVANMPEEYNYCIRHKEKTGLIW